VVGGSGVGKSSIVAAGLIPRLEAGSVEGSADWIYRQFMPGAMGDDPLLSFAACLGPEVTKQPAQLAAKLASGQTSIQDVVRSLLQSKPVRSELLVFADQFEELFTASTPEGRERFLHLMETGMATGRVRFVATLRAEFYARAIEDARLAAWLRDGSYPLAPPGLAEALEMITGPAEEAGLVLEDGLAQRIVDAFGDDLPLLAFAMSKLYEKCGPDGELTHGMFDSLGLADQIDSRAEQAFHELESDPEAQASQDAVFLQLVSVDEQQTVTRRRATLKSLAASGGASALVDKLVDARLLKTERRSDGEPIVSVAHEAVLVHWQRLKRWVDSRKDKLWLLQSVRSAAAEWDWQNRPDELLSSERRMRLAYATLEDLQPDLTPLERRFLGIGDAVELIEELGDSRTKHARRAYIGDRLAELGDTRPGVGVREDGTPDIVWRDVAGGEALIHTGAVVPVDAFRMAKYPVTWRQFRAFLEDPQGYFAERWWDGLPKASQAPRPHRSTPDNGSAEEVSWYDAAAFCRWLGARLGFEVRLPTEAEWRRAADGRRPAARVSMGTGVESAERQHGRIGIGTRHGGRLVPERSVTVRRSRYGRQPMGVVSRRIRRSGKACGAGRPPG